MAEQDEIAKIKEDLTQQQVASMTLLGIVKDIDHKVDELTGTTKATQIESSIIETRLTTVDRRLDAVKLDMTNSFRQVEATMATKQDVADLNTKLDTVIDLLTRKTGE
jgi:hypothetical protein